MPERAAVLRFSLGVNDSQDEALLRHVGATRAFFNRGLQEYKDRLDRRTAGEDLALPSGTNAFTNFLNAVVTEDSSMSWYAEVSKHCRDSAAVRLANAFKAFFASRSGAQAGGTVGFPRFVKRGLGDAVAFGNSSGREVRLDTDNSRRLILPKVGSVKLMEKGLLRQLKALLKRGSRITSVTLRRNGLRWVAALQLRVPTNETRRPAKAKAHPRGGVDLGLTTYATVASSISTGIGGEVLTPDGQVVTVVTEVANPRILRKHEGKLVKAQRELSRKEKGSKNRAKALAEVQKCHGRVKEARRTFMHQEAARLVKTHDELTLEDLSINGMLKNHALAKAISDAAWGSFIRLTTHKAHRAGTVVRLADKWLASTQTCSQCGRKRAVRLTLAERTFACKPPTGPGCGYSASRDTNAAEFLMKALTKVTVVAPPPPLKPGVRNRVSNAEKARQQAKSLAKALAEGRPAPKPPRPRGNPWRSAAVQSPTSP